MNSDTLGEKGQSRFQELCADAGLISNFAGRDRAGWDFIVDFPLDKPDRVTTLDKREAPISCHVQLKTMWAGNDRFEMRLSSAERLAKEVKPSFICVLTVSEDLEIVGLRAIHLSGPPLGRILKRLRFEQAKGDARINKKKISIKASEVGVLIDVSGAALDEFIRGAVGPSLQDYCRHKRAELDGLGFGQDRYVLRTKFTPRHPDHILNAFLGLESIDADEFSTTEKRFGIELPLHASSGSQIEFSIQPQPLSKCKITARSGLKGPAVTFNGEIFAPPREVVAEYRLKFVVRSPLFELVFDGDDCSWSTNSEAISETPRSILDWWNFSQFFGLLADGSAQLEIFPDNGPAIRSSIESELDPEHRQWALYCRDLLDAARRIATETGTIEERCLLRDLVARERQIQFLDAFLNHPERVERLSFDLEPTPAMDIPSMEKALFVTSVSFINVELGLAAVVNMVRNLDIGGPGWISTNFAPIGTRILRNPGEDVDSFLDESKQASGLIDPTILRIASSSDGLRWRRFSAQFGGLAKVGSGSDYAASLCSGLALSGARPG